jgi:hypothetical protein
MNILDTTGVSERKAELQKGIESLVLYTDKAVEDINGELISIQVERNGGSNLEITQGFVSLKRFLLASTFGDDAIGSFPASFPESFKTVAVIELTELGALVMGPNDKLKIALKQLDPAKKYVIDGIESPVTSDDVYMYEEKSIADEQTNYDLNVKNYDIAIIDDSSSITELNFTHDNGVVTKHSMREIRAVSQDIDPVAYVRNDGKVVPSFVGFIQLPLKGISSINIRKNEGQVVKFFFRKDVELLALGLIK